MFIAICRLITSKSSNDSDVWSYTKAHHIIYNKREEACVFCPTYSYQKFNTVLQVVYPCIA